VHDAKEKRKKKNGCAKSWRHSLAKLSASNLTVSVLVVSLLNSIVQVSEYKFTELVLSAVHLKD